MRDTMRRHVHSRRRNAFYGCVLACLCFTVTGCQEPAKEFVPHLGPQPAITADVPEYRFGVQPMRPSRRLWERYSALVDALNGSIHGFRLRLVSAQSDETYNARLRNRELDLAIVEPHSVLEMEPLGYRAIARAGKADRIAGMIVVHQDSNIRRIKDLKGKTIAFPSADALASAMLVRMYALNSGLNIDRSATVKYAGNQANALMEVANGKADAAGVSRDGWFQFVSQNWRIAEPLQPRWTTEDLPGAAIMVNPRMSKEDAKQVQHAFINLKNTEPGKRALDGAGFSEFRYGEEASYDELWEFLLTYRRAFPKLTHRAGTL